MIQPTSNLLGFNRADAIAYAGGKPSAAINHPTASGDHLLSSNTDALQTALKNTPEIRPEVVERGRHLAVDLNYPTRELIQRLSKLISESTDLSE